MIGENIRIYLLAIALLSLLTGGGVVVLQEIRTLFGLGNFITKTILIAFAEASGVNPTLIEIAFVFGTGMVMLLLVLSLWTMARSWLH